MKNAIKVFEFLFLIGVVFTSCQSSKLKMDVYEAKTGTVLYLLDNKKYYCKSASDSTYYAYSFGEWNTNGDTIEINSFYKPFNEIPLIVTEAVDTNRAVITLNAFNTNMVNAFLVINGVRYDYPTPNMGGLYLKKSLVVNEMFVEDIYGDTISKIYRTSCDSCSSYLIKYDGPINNRSRQSKNYVYFNNIRFVVKDNSMVLIDSTQFHIQNKHIGVSKKMELAPTKMKVKANIKKMYANNGIIDEFLKNAISR
jgi:hypothetical protein